MSTTNERRRSPRTAADLDIRFDLAGRAALARVRDISASGVCCTADRGIAPMTQVGLVIQIPTPTGLRDIVCRGAVVRSGPIGTGDQIAAYETAIFFTEIRDEDRVHLAEFVSAAARPTEL